MTLRALRSGLCVAIGISLGLIVGTVVGFGLRSTHRTPWRSVTLAAVLGFTFPLATMGTATAAPIGLPWQTAVAPPVLGPLPAGLLEVATNRAVARRPRETGHTNRDHASLLVDVPSGGIVAHRNPWLEAPSIGTVAATSEYYHVPIVIDVEATNRRGTWGRVELPYVWPRVDGWIPLHGLQRQHTFIHIDVDLSEHRVRVYKRTDLLFTAPGATGASDSPTPPGDYVVTDRVPFAAGSALGSFAFGLSGIQPHLPAGWSGGDQLAIHGTNDPSSIGTSASAGCVRVSEWALDRFEPLLRLGTPVVIHG
jgi:L,D-transpeptidase catalytic domain